jgi:hypothetical protein
MKRRSVIAASTLKLLSWWSRERGQSWDRPLNFRRNSICFLLCRILGRPQSRPLTSKRLELLLPAIKSPYVLCPPRSLLDIPIKPFRILLYLHVLKLSGYCIYHQVHHQTITCYCPVFYPVFPFFIQFWFCSKGSFFFKIMYLVSVIKNNNFAYVFIIYSQKCFEDWYSGAFLSEF